MCVCVRANVNIWYTLHRYDIGIHTHIEQKTCSYNHTLNTYDCRQEMSLTDNLCRDIRQREVKKLGTSNLQIEQNGFGT